MKSKSQQKEALLDNERNAVNAGYEIASQDYVQLTERYLHHLASFEWEDSYAFLADDIVFKMPDGDTNTRTAYTGLDEVKDFWNNYVKNSGNNKASFSDFVHVPVQVNQMIETIGRTGIFDLCYFSAELSYGSEKVDIRMHWVFHFNDEKKIDGIYSYYDRAPIIEAANKNFLASENKTRVSANEMIVQVFRIKSELSEAELLKVAKERASNFKDMPGLLQKYYIRFNEPNQYGGVYVWDSKESMQAFIKSDLAKTISQAYKAVGAPGVETSEVLFQLRD